jgi:hypothetical protein
VNIAASPGKSDGSRSMDPLGSRHVRGLVARNRHGVSRLVVRRDRSGEPARWIASINSSALGEFLEREIAMHRVEELVEASMVLVLHDWDLYRAAKAKR